MATRIAEFDDLLRTTTEGLSFRRNAAIERKLLAGCNRLVVTDELAGTVIGRTVYEIPRWRDAPIRRLRIWWLRRNYRTAKLAS